MKKLPVDSIGKIIKAAREKQGLRPIDLAWKINKPNITEKTIKNWENGKEIPNLDMMYLLAELLKLNPNELLNLRNTIQEESYTEPNWFARHLADRFLKIGKPGLKFIFEVILGICLITLAANWKKLENKMSDPNDPEQMNFIVQVIENNIDEYVYQNTSKDVSND